MEFMEGGSLTDILNLWSELKMNESQIANICKQVIDNCFLILYIFLDTFRFKLYS